MHALLKQRPSVENDKGWKAYFYGEYIKQANATRLGVTEHYGPLRVQRPFHPEGLDCLHNYLLHPPGGLVGGDTLTIHLNAHVGAHGLMTTPSAGKFYNNISGMKQRQVNKVHVANDAIVEYLPQENIIFNGADGELETYVELEGNGLFIGWEITALGRQAGDLPFIDGQLIQSIRIMRDGNPLFLDRLGFKAQDSIRTSHSGFQDQNVFASFIVTDNVDWQYGEWVDQTNSELNYTRIAITQKKDAFIVRALGNDVEELKETLIQVWEHVRPLVINKPACRPRIWNT
ncbi:urease accessory protein [Bermanella marisrubri]|uniref:urease accessory protein UreD n=1 Tax=Bermanella marisrubri TaxID=207949 RepID=UPI00058D72C2|nr:urease accessory protein UreD [Bermanella marisrubri]QIZ85666.1 urease accessory protein [Bermanella marisrubri]